MTEPDDPFTGMTVKAMVQELYADVKVIRPAVETLVAATLPDRVRALEMHNAEDAASARTAKNVALEFFRFGRWALATVIAVIAASAAWVIASGH